MSNLDPEPERWKRLDDADRYHEQAKLSDARIVGSPTDYSYGVRQYSALDLGGHVWTFSQSIADLDPISWGATRSSSTREKAATQPTTKERSPA
jgi:hypothetical protein